MNFFNYNICEHSFQFKILRLTEFKQYLKGMAEEAAKTSEEEYMWCYLKFELGLVGSAVNQFSCRTQRQFPRQLSKAIGSGSGCSWRVGIGTWGGCGSCAAPTCFFSFGTTFPTPSTFFTSLASSITKSSSWPAHQNINAKLVSCKE